jgi:hypothetical protein
MKTSTGVKPAFLRQFFRQFFNVSLFLGVILAVLAACSGARNLADKAPAAPRGPTTADYVLSPGQALVIAPSVSIKLDRVNDSRCKTGAVCVWAGYISYSFTLDGQQGPSSFVLSDSMPGASKSVTLQRLRFTLVSVEPEAPPALDQPAPAYRVTVKVAIT